MKMDLGISGKTAIVTGASTGIGRAIAEEFAQNGMRVVIVARNAEHLGATAKHITSQFKTEVLSMAANVADPAEPPRVVASAFERFGSVDLLINNAGVWSNYENGFRLQELSGATRDREICAVNRHHCSTG